MTKNVTVVDEFGNNYGETYQKRAKQLVKKGRAHFIDSNTISLVCPPLKMEDKEMSEDKKTVSLDYILEKINEILNNTDYIKEALEKIEKIPDSKGPGDMAASAKADAIANIVRSKEETNQQLITLLTTMYQSVDEGYFKRQQAQILMKYVDDPQAFENAKEALELIK